jgi:fatty acid/phospholipid biosynthesis enzyme
MESIIRNVSDIEIDPRHWLESSLGQHLEDNQRVMIMVLNVGTEPDEKKRRQAQENLRSIRSQTAANVQAQGITPNNVDVIVDEAISDIRHREQ